MFEETGDPWAISAALAHLGRYGRLTGQLEWAGAMTLRALDLAIRQDLPHTVQYVITDRAYLRLLGGDPLAARALFVEAMEVAEEVGNQVGIASICNGTGEAHLALGEEGEARQFHERALSDFEGLGMALGISYSRARLGMVEEMAGEWSNAASHHRAGLEAARASGDVIGLTLGVEGLGRVRTALEEWDEAARLFAAATVIRARSTLAPTPLETEANEAAAEVLRFTLGESALASLTRGFEDMEPMAIALAVS